MTNSKEKNFVSIVAYVHNNENEIADFFSRIHAIVDNNFDNYEFIFVNDNSYDQSIKELKEVHKTCFVKSVNIIHMSVFQGIEMCMNAGVDLAVGDFVFEFDNLTIDYPETLVMDVYKKSLEGLDIVGASPEKQGPLTSRLFYALFNKYAFSRYKIRTERFRILSRRAINRVKSLSQTIPYRKAIYANSGLKYETLIFQSLKRYASKHPKKYKQDLAIDTLILFTNIGYRFSIILSVSLLFFTFFAILYTLIVYFGMNKPVEGWTTTMLLLSTGFSGVFVILSILIKYLSILVNLVFDKKRYLIESVEKLQA